MGAVTYPDAGVAGFIEDRLIPVQLLYNAEPYASKYNIKWTPSILVLDESGKEHHRIVGFLPPEDFVPHLLLGIAKSSFDKDELDKASSDIDTVVLTYPGSTAAPEATYLRGVIEYKKTHQAEALKRALEELKREYPSSEWAKRAAPYGLL
jgi:thioredoxin-related protein